MRIFEWAGLALSPGFGLCAELFKGVFSGVRRGNFREGGAFSSALRFVSYPPRSWFSAARGVL